MPMTLNGKVLKGELLQPWTLTQPAAYERSS
jgi:hypothetical protein